MATPKNEQQNRHTPQWRSNAHEQPDVNHHSVQVKHAGSSNCKDSYLLEEHRVQADSVLRNFHICNGLFTKISWISTTGFATAWISTTGFATAARQRQQRKPNKEGTTTTQVKTPSNKQQGRLAAAQWQSKAHKEPDVNHLSVREMHTGHSNYNGSNFSTVRLLLAGGAQGSSTTKRKRWNHERQTTKQRLR